MRHMHSDSIFRMRGRRLGAVLVAGVLSLTACGNLLDVDNPNIVDPGGLASPAAFETLFAGALGDFSLANSGDNGVQEGHIQAGGSLTDELVNSETFPTRQEFDQRVIDIRNGNLRNLFENVHRARRAAEFAAGTIQNAAGDTSRLPELYALAGYTYIILGEHYCSGVPVSEVDLTTSEITFGSPLATAELFQRAVDRFDSALLVDAAGPGGLLATIGKARAIMNLSNDRSRFAEAAALVAAVPTTFSYVTTHTTAVDEQRNGVFAFVNQNGRYSVADLDGTNGADFRTAMDPRVLWRLSSLETGFDNATPLFDQAKYPDPVASIQVASGIEARLIEAEAALAAANPAGALGILNALRADVTLYQAPPPGFVGFPVPPLPPLADPGTDEARIDLLFRERAFWLYLTGHRMGDLRRLVRQYGRTPDAVFPGGGGQPYIVNGNNKGGTFGTDVTFPIPFDEENNPNFTGCSDRSA